MKKTVAIVHYNTPELLRACMLSILKQGAEWHFVVFENSDKAPLLPQQIGGGVTMEVIDNTKGQVIDFEAELEKYPKRLKRMAVEGKCNFGSVKHMMSVDWLIWNIKEPFVLCDSDILLKASIDDLFDDGFTAGGKCETEWGRGMHRLLPYMCYINAPECRRLGLHFFDPKRAWGLGAGTENGNWYDTGASFLEDLKACKEARLKTVDVMARIEHLGAGSYKGGEKAPGWLARHRYLWEPLPQPLPLQGGEKRRNQNDEIMIEHVSVFSQDGKQYHLSAEKGWLLKAKDTGAVRQVVNTMKIDRWEVIADPTVAAVTQPHTQLEEKPKERKRRKPKRA